MRCRRFVVLLGATLGVALLAGGCGVDDSVIALIPDEPWIDRPDLSAVESDSAQQLGRRLNAFAVELFGQLRGDTDGSGENLSFSPASIATALVMTLGGARGETAAQLRRVMHLELPPDQIHPTMSALLGHWTSPRDTLAAGRSQGRKRNQFFELSVANRLFGQQGLSFEDAFVILTRERYGAPLQPMDFEGQPDVSRRRINAWVEQRTQQRIEQLIPPRGINRRTRLALVNAMYFKAGWAYPFESHSTGDASFMADGTRAVTVKMMRSLLRAGFAHHQADGLKVLEMPYVESDFSMVFLLPDRTDGLESLEGELTAETLERWTGVLPRGSVQIALPRFRVESPGSTALKRPLEALGLRALFDVHLCDLTGIAKTTPSLVVEEVFHRSFVAINEDGTEAAAATAVLAGVGSAPGPPPPTFVADHPFLFLIRDRRSGTILFLGRVTDPSQ